MPASSRAFWLPRRGYDPADYEDAFAANAVAGRFAVADGATEGCFTDLWARLLVNDFVAGSACEVTSWPASLPALQDRWASDVSARRLPWYAESSVSQGAFAAFLGLVLSNSPLLPGEAGANSPLLPGEGQGVRETYPRLSTPETPAVQPPGEVQGARESCCWQAVAVGDSCLLHTCDNVLVRAFPLERGEQFDNFPKLVGSRMSVKNVAARQSLWLDGQGRPGDRLWMMTDALAHWCLAENEAGKNPWNDLESLLTLPESQDPFVSLVEGLRDRGKLRNDDVTLLAIEL